MELILPTGLGGSGQAGIGLVPNLPGLGAPVSSYTPTGQYLQNLVEWYALNEASGDAIGSHAGKTLTAANAPGSTTGRVGNCRTFVAASSQAFSRASESAFEFGDTDFAVAGWMYLADKSSYYTGISKYGGSTNEWITHYYHQGGDNFACYVGSAGEFHATTFGAPSAGTWYFIVVQHDHTNDLVKISVNAGAEDTKAAVGGVTTGDSPVSIGRWVGGEFLNGRMDEVAIWNRLLTDNERTWLYNSGNGRSYAEAAAV